MAFDKTEWDVSQLLDQRDHYRDRCCQLESERLELLAECNRLRATLAEVSAGAQVMVTDLMQRCACESRKGRAA